MTTPATCHGCGERLHATHRAGCPVLEAELNADHDHRPGSPDYVNRGELYTVQREHAGLEPLERDEPSVDPGPEQDRRPDSELDDLAATAAALEGPEPGTRNPESTFAGAALPTPQDATDWVDAAVAAGTPDPPATLFDTDHDRYGF